MEKELQLAGQREACAAWRKKNPGYQAEWRKKNPGKAQAYKRKYRAKHKARLLEEEALWRETHREVQRDRAARYAAANPEKVKESQAQYNKNNRHKRRELEADWRKRNPDKVQAIKSRRRARKSGAVLIPFDVEQIERRWNDLDNRCVYCGTAWEQKDHFIPLAKGGSHSLENLLPACLGCNSSKRDSEPLKWLRKRPFTSVPFGRDRWIKLAITAFQRSR
jgi:hypothetical protein